MSDKNKDFEDLKFLTELFGNEDIAADEKGETAEEIEADLKEMGYDIEDLNQKMGALKKRMAGKLALKQARETRMADEGKKGILSYPDNREEMIEQMQVMEDQLGIGKAARQTSEMTDQDLRAKFEALSELAEEETDAEDETKPDKS